MGRVGENQSKHRNLLSAQFAFGRIQRISAGEKGCHTFQNTPGDFGEEGESIQKPKVFFPPFAGFALPQGRHRCTMHFATSLKIERKCLAHTHAHTHTHTHTHTRRESWKQWSCFIWAFLTHAISSIFFFFLLSSLETHKGPPYLT